MTAESPQLYEIRIAGHLNSRWDEWFGGFTITNLHSGEAVLRGWVVDQSALHGILARLHDLNLPLVSVQRIQSVRGNASE